MLTALLKIPWLRLKYRYFPDKAQAFWAQELLDSHGLGGKLGQVLAQGKSARLPKSSLLPHEAQKLFQAQFKKNLTVTGEVLAASMGQVFFGEAEGHKLAVKILHPGIREKLLKEIDHVLLLGGYFAKAKNFSFNKSLFRRFLTEIFEEETDLRREALFQEKFRNLFLNDSRFHIPQVLAPLSNDTVLSQEYVPSVLARDAKTFSSADIFDFFFCSLLKHHLLHGDLNDRNWGITPLGKTVVYDFGCSQIISDRRIGGLKKLLSNSDVSNAFLEFGVRLEATPFRGREQELRDAILGPLFEVPVTPALAYSESLQQRFGGDIKLLREFTDPWVLLMMRSLFSLIRIYQERGGTVDLGRVVAPYLTEEKKMSGAQEIKIDVRENGKIVVAMTLPITALDNLEQLMPSKVQSKIDEEGLNLKQIIASVRNSGLGPQDLFRLQVADRSYRVWIE